MERMRLSRFIGAAYILGAILGLIISIGGLLLLWTTRPDAANAVDEMVALARRTIDATSLTVEVANTSLNEASENLALMQVMLEGVAETLDESEGLIASTGEMISTDLVDVVNEAQSSLTDVEDSAEMVDNALRVVDSTLSLLSRLPLVGPVYEPRTPLQESVQSVSRSLNPLPGSFARIQRELETSAANVAVISTEVALLAEELGQIETTLAEAREVTVEYNSILTNLSSRLDRLEQRLPTLLNAFYIGVTLLLVSMLVTHAALLIHGIVLVL